MRCVTVRGERHTGPDRTEWGYDKEGKGQGEKGVQAEQSEEDWTQQQQQQQLHKVQDLY